MPRAPVVGICILNWNAGDALAYCARTLLAASPPFPVLLVIVDNHSSDHSVARMRKELPSVALIENDENLGYAAGNNVGARWLLDRGCDSLVFVNPDVVLPLESLMHLIEDLSRVSVAGCAGGVPVTPSGKSTDVARTRPSALEKIVGYGPLRRVPLLGRLSRGHWVTLPEIKAGVPVYAVSGACVAFRAEAFREIGGFDENTFLFEEELIAAERLRACGWSVIVATDAVYSHQRGLCTSKMPYRRHVYFLRSESYLLRYYYGWSALSCFFLRVFRCVELCVYGARWWILHIAE
jgi:N-acetylglucosaminyl-diphospho-decaprenol L-rhamnosyltransferase